jgi:thioredoxin reductase
VTPARRWPLIVGRLGQNAVQVRGRPEGAGSRGGYASGVRTRVKAEPFAELSDPVVFPRLSDAEIEQLAERGQRRTYETDEQLFEHGMRDAPFFIIEHGTVDIVEHRLEEDVWFARMDGGTFIGDVSMFTGEPTLAAGVAVEPTSVIVFERPELREMLAELPEFGELVLQTMTARRAGTSTRIENFLGFPSGISRHRPDPQGDAPGPTLRRRAVELPPRDRTRGWPRGMVRVDLDDGQHVVARTLLVATGAQWRTFEAEGIDRFTGAGVYHIATATSARRCEGEDVIVVGGGNSAGQAAVHLSQQARSVRMVVRRDSLAPTMSRYLLNRIERAANIEIVPNTEIAAEHGNGNSRLSACARATTAACSGSRRRPSS